LDFCENEPRGTFPPSERPRESCIAPGGARQPRRAARRAASLVAVAFLVACAGLLSLAGGRLLGATAGESSSPFIDRLGSGLGGTGTALSGSGWRTAVARVDRGVVDISSSFAFAHAEGAATGMVISPDGLVLTNNHVIDGATSLTATVVTTGQTFAATVVGYDRHRDIALIRLNGASGLSTVPLGHSSTLVPGARVAAVGNARGVGGLPKVAPGRITALGRTIVAGDAGGANSERLTGMIQTSAQIIGGDSGGPLIDSSGRVVGMNAASSAGPGVSRQPVTGFAIPIDTAMQAARLIAAGRQAVGVHLGQTAFLGVALLPGASTGPVTPAGPSGTGAVVDRLLSGYPAQGAGLVQGDVIVSLDGRPVTSAAGLTDLLGTYHPGDLVRLAWTDSSGRFRTALVKLAAGPPS
jgi:S1-C subfamily serine protease